MAPDVSFHLTNDSFDRFADLLRPHGITVRDTGKSTSENLERGSMESESYMGFLSFGGFEFHYHRHKSLSAENDLTRSILRDNQNLVVNPNVQVFTTYFDVTITDHEPKVLEQLFVLLERAFPQPPRPPRSLPRPRPWTMARIRSRVGCLLLALLFFAMCFFPALGIRSFFHAL
jgi:hypothetical protein